MHSAAPRIRESPMRSPPVPAPRPKLGFISLPKEVVVALTDVGLVWGAIDFGSESGDVMHFDCRNIPGC